MNIQQYNPSGARIPFWIVANSGNYPGAAGANPTIELNQPNSDAWVAATGAIVDVGNGGYRYTPSAQDASVPGIVLARVIGPTADIEIPFQFVVCQPSFLASLVAAPQNLASIAANIRLLAKVGIPPILQGEIQ